jgi:hypothetical protein
MASTTTAVPAPAAAVGDNIQTFGPAVTLGSNWQKFNFFGVDPGSVGAIQNADGSVTITGGGDDYGAQLSTASVGGTGSFSGIAFGGGGYFEATMSFNGPASFWANDIETMDGVSTGTGPNQWPGQAAGYGDWIETDFAEFDATGVYGFGVHNWFGTVGSGNDTNTGPVSGSPVFPAGADYTKPNTYGFLWVPATATTQGYAKYYFNGVQVGNTISWNQYNPSLGPPPSITNGTAFSVLDKLHLALILGTGSSGTPNTVYSVSVWQNSSANDISTPPVCFLAGTRIATPLGETPAEQLSVGDQVRTASGQVRAITWIGVGELVPTEGGTQSGEKLVESLIPGDVVCTLADGRLRARPVKWIGRRRIDLTAHPRPEMVAPVRIQRDAFAENVPHTDLLLSPDHAIFVDGKLICARQLINGTTLRQETNLPSIEYFHVELDTHAILLAEGLPVESYLNTGNRGFFANSDGPLVLHPNLTDEPDHPTREVGSCAPFVGDEANVWPIWQRLADRAARIGKPVPQRVTTPEANVLLVTKRPKHHNCKPAYADSNLVIFVLPRDAEEVRLVSLAQSPTEARPWLEDRRRLGVRVKRIVLRSANEVCEVPVDHPDLTNGWWAVERDGQMICRWTDGDAVLPLPAMAEQATLEIHLAGAMTYIMEAEPVRQIKRRAA